MFGSGALQAWRPSLTKYFVSSQNEELKRMEHKYDNRRRSMMNIHAGLHASSNRPTRELVRKCRRFEGFGVWFGGYASLSGRVLKGLVFDLRELV